MIEIKVCPSTLTEGFNSYSPNALDKLFNGIKVDPYLSVPSPSIDSAEAKNIFDNIGRISLSGVQPKFAMIIGEDFCLRYAQMGEEGTYILKPSPNAYHLLNKKYCPANEHLTMQIASQVYGIETAENGLCFFENDEAAYITKRFDIHPTGKYLQEDFASLMGYTKANGGSDFKYCNSSYEECAEIINRYVKVAAIDILRFFKLVLYNFISLNDDAHLKNFSLIERNGEYRLSPAYDLINTSLHLRQSRIFALNKGLLKEGMSLSDTHQVGNADFVEFGKRIGLPDKLIKREIDRFSQEYPAVADLINRSFLSDNLKEQYFASMNYRCKMLSF